MTLWPDRLESDQHLTPAPDLLLGHIHRLTGYVLEAQEDADLGNRIQAPSKEVLQANKWCIDWMTDGLLGRIRRQRAEPLKEPKA